MANKLPRPHDLFIWLRDAAPFLIRLVGFYADISCFWFKPPEIINQICNAV